VRGGSWREKHLLVDNHIGRPVEDKDCDHSRLHMTVRTQEDERREGMLGREEREAKERMSTKKRKIEVEGGGVRTMIRRARTAIPKERTVNVQPFPIEPAGSSKLRSLFSSPPLLSSPRPLPSFLLSTSVHLSARKLLPRRNDVLFDPLQVVNCLPHPPLTHLLAFC